MIALAVGWATVDLDRAALELTPRLVAGTAFQEAPDCDLLGGRCRIGRLAEPGADGASLVILLEPSTEGRLAATLARHGEGPMAIWLEDQSYTPDLPDPPDPPDLPDTPSDPRRSIAMAGPFGTEALLLGGPIHGPHRLVVLAGPGTITP